MSDHTVQIHDGEHVRLQDNEIDWTWPVEVVECNRDLAELWIDEVDLLEIHKNASMRSDNRVTGALNKVYRQRDRCCSVLRGYKIRELLQNPILGK